MVWGAGTRRRPTMRQWAMISNSGDLVLAVDNARRHVTAE
jgi:hypothetical protein